MATDVQTDRDASVTALVSGIISDAQELMHQQFNLLKTEVRDDIRKTKEALLALGLGAGVALLGVLLLVLALVHLTHWAFNNVPHETLPLWACYGIWAVVFLVIGGVLCYAGKKKFDSFNPLPEQTAEALQENVKWITHPTNPK
jgi:uncharacterized membrane protein YqjE